jgi:hypothetical protein
MYLWSGSANWDIKRILSLQWPEIIGLKWRYHDFKRIFSLQRPEIIGLKWRYHDFKRILSLQWPEIIGLKWRYHDFKRILSLQGLEIIGVKWREINNQFLKGWYKSLSLYIVFDLIRFIDDETIFENSFDVHTVA